VPGQRADASEDSAGAEGRPLLDLRVEPAPPIRRVHRRLFRDQAERLDLRRLQVVERRGDQAVLVDPIRVRGDLAQDQPERPQLVLPSRTTRSLEHPDRERPYGVVLNEDLCDPLLGDLRVHPPGAGQRRVGEQLRLPPELSADQRGEPFGDRPERGDPGPDKRHRARPTTGGGETGAGPEQRQRPGGDRAGQHPRLRRRLVAARHRPDGSGATFVASPVLTRARSPGCRPWVGLNARDLDHPERLPPAGRRGAAGQTGESS
jgi:hypothetical protein